MINDQWLLTLHPGIGADFLVDLPSKLLEQLVRQPGDGTLTQPTHDNVGSN